MPPRLRLRPLLGSGQTIVRVQAQTQARLSRPATTRPSQACLFCSHQRTPKPRISLLETRLQSIARRRASTAAAEAPASKAEELPAEEPEPARPRSPEQIRADLASTLNALQQQAGVLLNISRLQLAIRSLQQPSGHESIRVAILGLTSPTSATVSGGKSAKELLRLILADPLQDEQPWEAQLASHDPKKPLIVRVRAPTEGGAQNSPQGGTVQFDKDEGLAEIEISSPVLNGNQLEFLVMESSLAVPRPPASISSDPLEGVTTENFEETALVPTVEIPTTQDGLRFTPVTTPVHQALVVSDGLLGAAAVANLPLSAYPTEMKGAVNLRLPVPEIKGSDLPFTTFDVATSNEALGLFRESVANAKAYETLWMQGGVSAVSQWLRDGALHRGDGTTKPPVRQLVASVLRNAGASIQAAEAKLVHASTTTQSGVPVARAFVSLNTGLADWAEAAHAELQSQLDLAFSGRRWRKLGWWKLFWRADDVTMLSTDLVTQRFLPQAEQDVVFLAGRVDEAVQLAGLRASVDNNNVGKYTIPIVAADSSEEAAALTSANGPRTKWPTHIAFTRRYLLDKTVPALQALAQKLVLQTLGTSGLSTALAVLTYLSSSGAYEAGAVAAVGLVWSLGRMQKKWEAARQFWEGEVREEGRKAVRAVEASVASTLDEARDVAVSGGKGGADRRHQLRELRQARALVDQAKADLAKLK